MDISVDIQILPGAEGISLPKYETGGASGMDLIAAISHDIKIEPGKLALVPTGLRVAAPTGCEFQVRSRSGLALKNGVVVLNSPGTIDSDYRGEIQVILVNFGELPFLVTRGMRIAQLILARVETVTWNVVSRIDETERGSGGFGHTGL